MVGEFVLLLIVVSGLYLAIRGFIRGSSQLPQARGSKLIACPVTKKPAIVQVAAGVMSKEGFPVLDRFKIGECSLWPAECEQGCLNQLGT